MVGGGQDRGRSWRVEFGARVSGLVGARAAGFRVHEVPVSHFPRTSGRATGARPDVILRAAWELGRRAVVGPMASSTSSR